MDFALKHTMVDLHPRYKLTPVGYFVKVDTHIKSAP